MSPQDAGAAVMTGLDLLALLVGGALFWYGLTRPCTMCEVIADGDECWNCGKVKEAP